MELYLLRSPFPCSLLMTVLPMWLIFQCGKKKKNAKAVKPLINPGAPPAKPVTQAVVAPPVEIKKASEIKNPEPKKNETANEVAPEEKKEVEEKKDEKVEDKVDDDKADEKKEQKMDKPDKKSIDKKDDKKTVPPKKSKELVTANDDPDPEPDKLATQITQASKTAPIKHDEDTLKHVESLKVDKSEL